MATRKPPLGSFNPLGTNPTNPTNPTDNEIPSGIEGSINDAVNAASKRLESSLEGLTADFPELGEHLSSLLLQLQKTDSEVKRLAASGDVASKRLTDDVQRQLDALEDLEHAIKETTEGQVVNAEKTKEVAKSLDATKAAIQRVTDGLEGSRVPRTFAEKLRESFGPDVSRLYQSGTPGMAKAAGLAIAQGAGGGTVASGYLQSLGPQAQVLDAIVSTMNRALERQAHLTQVATEHFLNYGQRGTDAAGNLRSEMDEVHDAMVEATLATLEFNGDAEATKAVLTSIATETGASFREVGENVRELERLRMMGLGTIDELGQQVTKRANEAGMSVTAAVSEINAIAMDAQAIKLNAVDGTAVSMRDFYAAVQDVSQGMDSMGVSQRSLSKVMAVGAKTAANLGLSYDRIVAASKGFGRSLTSNFDEGLATVTAYEDVANDLADAEAEVERLQTSGASGADILAAERRLADARFNMDRRNAGEAPDILARRRQETGMTSTLGSLSRRAEFVRTQLGPNAAEADTHLLESFVGKLDVSTERVWRQLLGTTGSMEAKVAEMREAAPEDLEAAVEAAAKAQMTPGRLMDTSLEVFMQRLTDILEPAVSTIAWPLKAIRWVIEKIWGKWGTPEPGKVADKKTLNVAEERRKQGFYDMGTPAEIAAQQGREETMRMFAEKAATKARRLLGLGDDVSQEDVFHALATSGTENRQRVLRDMGEFEAQAMQDALIDQGKQDLAKNIADDFGIAALQKAYKVGQGTPLEELQALAQGRPGVMKQVQNRLGNEGRASLNDLIVAPSRGGTTEDDSFTGRSVRTAGDDLKPEAVADVPDAFGDVIFTMPEKVMRAMIARHFGSWAATAKR